MRRVNYFIAAILSIAFFLPPNHTIAQHEHDAEGKDQKKAASCCQLPGTNAEAKNNDLIQLGSMKVPNVELVNQDGEKTKFYDLIKGKVVAMNFIFTTCTTICPPMGANFAALNKKMQDHAGEDLVMLSISLDPITDTPERLKAWSEKFKPGKGWTLLTGDKGDITQLLKSLEVFTPLIEEHAPILLLGTENQNNWTRTNGLTSPDKVVPILNNMLNANASLMTPAEDEEKAENPELKYFTNVELVNQHGETMRLYDDILKDNIVVINPFFAECEGSCPVMNATMSEIQIHAGDRLGKDILLVSITVDPENDTPDKLKDYAKRFDARKGWYFLSGTKENVETALAKLGNQVAAREDHKTIFLMGNVETRLWKKTNGLAPAEQVVTVFDTVIKDIE